MYSVAFNVKGERFHLKFEDDGSISGGEGGPDVRHFLAAVRATGISPSIVCEGRDSQDVGARLMRDHWATMAEGCFASVSPADMRLK